MLTCSACNAPIPLPSEPVTSLICPSCGRFTPVPVELRAMIVDANRNGIPDGLEEAEPGSGWSSLPSLDTVPSPPRRPSARARKLLFGFEGSQGVMLTIGGVFLVFGLIVGVALCWSLPEDLALLALGETTTGVIQGCSPVENVTVNDRHPTRITFGYTVDGAAFTADSSALNPTCAVGDPVQVQFLPDSPAVAPRARPAAPPGTSACSRLSFLPSGRASSGPHGAPTSARSAPTATGAPCTRRSRSRGSTTPPG